MDFPNELPSDQIATLAGLIVRGQLSAKRREAACAAWVTQGYVMGTLIRNPAPEAGTLAVLESMTESEAIETLNLLAGNQQAAIDRTKLLRLLNFLMQLAPLLIG